MAWIDKADILGWISGTTFNGLEGDADTCIAAAESEAFMFLSGLFDTEEILKQKGDEREAFLVRVVCDIAIYNMCAANAYAEVPELYAIRYQQSREWLEMISKGKIQPPLREKFPRRLKDDGKATSLISITSDSINRMKL